MKKLIKVKKEYIKRGCKGSEYYCPIALALKDEGFKNVRVNFNFIDFSITDESKILSILSNHEIKDFIYGFDFPSFQKKEVKPFHFFVDI